MLERKSCLHTRDVVRILMVFLLLDAGFQIASTLDNIEAHHIEPARHVVTLIYATLQSLTGVYGFWLAQKRSGTELSLNLLMVAFITTTGLLGPVLYLNTAHAFRKAADAVTSCQLNPPLYSFAQTTENAIRICIRRTKIVKVTAVLFSVLRLGLQLGILRALMLWRSEVLRGISSANESNQDSIPLQENRPEMFAAAAPPYHVETRPVNPVVLDNNMQNSSSGTRPPTYVSRTSMYKAKE